MFLVHGLWIFQFVVLVASNEWSYEGDTGPLNWSNIEASCNGTRQSPINIERKSSQESKVLNGIHFEGYNDLPRLMNLTNNGHTVFIELPGSHLYVKDDSMPDRYKFAQFHFHWGKTDETGAEHTFDGQHYPMEMHLVHFRETYGTLSQAQKKADGIAVIAVLFEITKEDNLNFEKLIRNLPKVAYRGDSQNLKHTFPLSLLLPDQRALYFRYQGSLTTPHCDESVFWTVFNDTVKISDDQLDEFRELKESYLGNKTIFLENNFRPLQALNQRQINKSVVVNAPTKLRPSLVNNGTLFSSQAFLIFILIMLTNLRTFINTYK